MSASQKIPRLPETINFPQEEEKTLALWKQLDVFYTCLKQSKDKPRFSFYDGPPFATGMPHYGHILTGTIKDVVTRYAHQQGFHVERRFGWDCHGLPVEYEIDKTLGIKGPEDVQKMGIAQYNKECRKIVTRYVAEWEMIVNRIGRWIDFKNDYKTMYPWYMESIWWVFKQLYSKGLVYLGNKVMPYSPACNTPLSNFESTQNYKMVTDPAVTVTLPLIGDKDNASLLIWTTTPWTLPSNLAACVNAKLTYVRVKQISSQNVYIVMEARLESVFKAGDYEVLDKFAGISLKDKQYEPIFPYFDNMKEKGAFRVLVDDYVSEESGTGVVHQAAYFGEDDFRVCLAAGIITRDMPPICPVDESGRMTKPVVDFEGQYFKDADKNIVAALKAKNRLFNLSQCTHSYPFCWRSDQPLMYKAVRSWFIRVEQMSEKLQDASSHTYWVPDFVKEKRFGNWLRDARDWAISRNRYWGTPIPIWMSEKEMYCIGSIAELEELTGTKVSDLHRENIDHLEIPSKIPGNPPLRRIPEVFDCWFESGSMPFAQHHYPFSNRKDFEAQFPANFISEGIDQTRGWFYTLLVISTALFGKAPFKNLVVNGLVLASDGQKMSKRKQNYPDPLEVINKYGADALRLYLINSPVVRAENLRFKEDGVKDIIKDVFLPWYNAFRFLFQSLDVYVKEQNIDFTYDESKFDNSNIMDKWILSYTQSLLEHVRKEMAVYHLYNVLPRLTKYVDDLTNWYVRMNRKRLKGEGGAEDCKQALMTLCNVIYNMIRIMSPFAPFLTEHMYQYLKQLLSVDAASVHYLMLPEPNHSLIDLPVERAVGRMQAVIELGRVVRDRKTLPIKTPLPEIVVVHQDPQYIADVESLKFYVLSELNVRSLTVTTNKTKYGITLRAEPDFKVLGARLKQDFKAVTLAIKGLCDKEINDMIKQGNKVIAGHQIELSEIRLIFKVDDVSSTKYEVHSDNDVVILLDVTPDRSMQDEGTAREIINRVQKLRKRAHLVPTDEISVYYKATGEIEKIAQSHSEFIEGIIKAPFKSVSTKPSSDNIIIEEEQLLKDCTLNLTLCGNVQESKKGNNGEVPIVQWVNVKLDDNLKSRYGSEYNEGIVLLETGTKKVLGLEELKLQITRLFGLTSNFDLWTTQAPVRKDGDVSKLNSRTVFVLPCDFKPRNLKNNVEPFCKVSNFVCSNGKTKGTVILENPKGIVTTNRQQKLTVDLWSKQH